MKRVAQPSPMGVDDGIVDEGGSRSDRFGLSPIQRIASGIILLCFLTHSSEPALARDCKDPATIIGVSSADELVLDHPIEGTTTVRLAGIDPPELTARSDTETARSVDGTEATLSQLIAWRAACLELFDRRQDRYGRLLAHVYRDDGLWIQGELLRRGLARVHVTADTRPLASEMLTIENRARRAGEGLWRDPRFRVRSAAEAGRALGSFQLVEGRVVEAARRADRWYLNFGEDWRSDFTVIIPAQAPPDFVAAKLDPYALKGHVIRVRGWVESFNGPMIEAVIPEQIEIIDEPEP
jgi:endonuclease YncB( thermonuclease family)